jgi:hypothetical protein
LQRALVQFREGNLEQASSLLQCCREDAPDDPVVALYAERCRLGRAPAAGGVTVLAHK